MVHLIRNAMRFVASNSMKAVAGALKPIYQAANAEAARVELDAFEQSGLGQANPHAVAVFENAWERFTSFLAFPPEVRPVIYTTNAIESLNYQLRKVTKNRGHFPNDAAVVKLLWLAICNIEDKRARDPREGTRTWPRRETHSRRHPRRGSESHELEESPRATRNRLPRPRRGIPITPRYHPLTQTT